MKNSLGLRFSKALDSLIKVRGQRISGAKPSALSSISRSEAAALTAIGDNDGINLKHLAQALLVTPGTASVTVDRLIRRNFVIRKPYEKDRRGITLHLTTEGRRLATSYQRFIGDISRAILERLDEDEAARFVEDLESLTE